MQCAQNTVDGVKRSKKNDGVGGRIQGNGVVKITLSERNDRNVVEFVVQGIEEWRGQNNVI